jgi:HlyD family secretion protein
MAKVLKFLAVIVVLSGVAVGGFAWYQGRGPDDQGVTLIEVSRGEIVEKAVAVGQIEPRVKFHIKSKISGIVGRCSAEIGDAVRVGDPLFEIAPDPTPIELVAAERELESRESAHRRAEADWRRVSELSRQGIISSDEVDSSREAFDQARIQLDRARDNLALIREGRIDGRGETMESIIRAPAAGILLERNVDPGDPVVPLTSFQEGTELATLADMSDLIFKGTVDEIDVGKLQLGLVARLKIGALPDAEVTGRLTRIAPQAVERDNAKLFEVEIELDPASAVTLRAGYSANADLIIREKTDILTIPERLVHFEKQEGDDEESTWVELTGGAPGAEPRKVVIETGLSDGLNLEVVEGLSEGDQVVQRPPRDILES